MTPDDFVLWVHDKGVQDHIDEIVHATASSMASAANNEGLEGQLKFLTDAGWTEEEIKNALEVAQYRANL